MSTKKRKLFTDGIYHVYNRAVKKSMLFRENSDYDYFFNRICLYKKRFEFSVYAVCLMGNHFHILLRDNGLQLSNIMDSIECSYAKRYSRKYDHSGYVFESRFKSNPIIDERGFLKLYRYVIRNPVAAGISDSVSGYEWVTPDPDWDRYGIVDFEYVNEVFTKTCKASHFEYIDSNVDDLWTDEIEIQRLDDKDAYELFINISDHIEQANERNINISKSEKLGRVIRISIDRGVTYKQLNKFTGLTYYKLRKLKII